MKRIPNLVLEPGRNPTFRIDVPRDLRRTMGCVIIKKSLGNADLKSARLEAQMLRAHFQNLFHELRNNGNTIMTKNTSNMVDVNMKTIRRPKRTSSRRRYSENSVRQFLIRYATYKKLYGGRKGTGWKRNDIVAFEAACEALQEAVDDRMSVHDLTRDHAIAVHEQLKKTPIHRRTRKVTRWPAPIDRSRWSVRRCGQIDSGIPSLSGV